MESDRKTFVDQAIEYASLGWKAYPIQPPFESNCTCHKGDSCEDAGKHPYYDLGGMNAATTDCDKLNLIFGSSDANLGLLCDNFFVLDVETQGIKDLDLLIDENGPLPLTPKAASGGGGLHYFFQDDKRVKKGRTRINGLSIDTPRQIVAPPSVHRSGGKYKWLVLPSQAELAVAPAWLLDWLSGASLPTRSVYQVENDQDLAEHPGAEEGERNTTICRLVGRYLAKYGDTPNLLRLAIEWGERCKPPYPQSKIEKIVASFIRKHLDHQNSSNTEPQGLELTVRRFSDIEPKLIQWLWFGRLALGKITLLTGDGGVGKSILTCDIAYRVSRGIDFTDGSPCPSGEVFFIGAEDGAEDTIRPRLEAAGADLDRVRLISGPVPIGEKFATPIDLSRHRLMLDELLERHPESKLLVIDPIMDFLGDATNSDKATDVRRVLSPLRELAEKHEIAIVAMNHLNKSGKGPKSRSLGSGAFVQVSRVELRVCEDPSDEDRRLLLPVKNNLAKCSGLAYRIEPWEENPDIGRIAWQEGSVDISIHDVESDQRQPAKKSAKAEAKVWLWNQLSDGPVASNTLKQAAEDDEIAWRTIERARKELQEEGKIDREQMETGWYWHRKEHTEGVFIVD